MNREELTWLFSLPLNIQVEEVKEGTEVFEILRPIMGMSGKGWKWNGVASIPYTLPTFDSHWWRMWCMRGGYPMVATRQPDLQKLKEWVDAVSHE